MNTEGYTELERIEEWRDFMFRGCTEAVTLNMVTHYKILQDDWIECLHDDGIFQYNSNDVMWSKTKHLP